jgi:hypothetical protein
MDTPQQVPAESDRSHWPTRMGTLAEMESQEVDISATTTVEERFAIMWQLAKDAWAFRGEPVGEPPFPRHPVRLIRRGS